MDNREKYFEANRELWNETTPVHFSSEMYNMDEFLAGKSSLQEIEMCLLENLEGKELLHMQCHFGQDTLSLARTGANVTGVDLSDESIQTARSLAAKLGMAANFVRSNVLEMDKVLDQTFDVIYTSYGTIGWLPELSTWARLMSTHLRPGGTFYIIDFHPVLWMFDLDFTKFQYSYFNRGVIEETVTGTYTDRKADIGGKEYGWNHSLSTLIGSLLNNGLGLELIKEYDYSPYDCFNNTVQVEKGYQIKGLEGMVPMVYAIKMKKPA